MPRVGVTITMIGEDGTTMVMHAAREDHVPPTSSDYKVSMGAGLMRIDELVGDALDAVHRQAEAMDVVDPRNSS